MMEGRFVFCFFLDKCKIPLNNRSVRIKRFMEWVLIGVLQIMIPLLGMRGQVVSEIPV